MAKNWEKLDIFNSTTKEDKSTVEKREGNFKILIRNTKTLPIKKIKENSAKRYEEAKAEDDQLIAAFDNKMLKSKRLIKQAIQIKKERAVADKQSKNKTGKKEENVSTETMEQSA